MAVTDYWLGASTETTAKVCVRSDATETVTLTCNGSSYDKAAVTSVLNGIVVFTVTGLTAGQNYSYTVGSVTDSLKTLPSSGEFTFGWFSCMERNRSAIGALRAALSGVAGYASLGDTPYTNGGDASFGISTTSTNSDQTQANFYNHYQQAFRNVGMQKAMRLAPFYLMADDHEWCGDDWDHTLTQANDAGAGFTTQAQVDTVWNTGNTAQLAYSQGNPSNSDTDAVAEAPSEAAAADSFYPPRYSRWTVVNAEFFLLDCISHKSPLADVDDATKTMLGSQQKLWLKNQLSASTSTFKIILSPKRLWDATGGAGNTDSWGSYTTERDEMLAYIESNITGTVWLSGDQHAPAISASVKVADATTDIASTSDTYNSVDVCACPVGVNSQTGLTTITQNRQIFEKDAPDKQCYGILKVTSDYIEPQLWDSNTGIIFWSGRVYAGTNLLVYPDTPVGV